MKQPFKIGISPDFYEEARGPVEEVTRARLDGLAGIEYASMPPQPGKLATPEAVNQFDAIFALALQITPESLRGVERTVIVARWGVGYDRIDVDALTEADIVLAITPKAVRRPVAEAILTFAFALSKNLLLQDRIARAGKWRSDLGKLGWNLLLHDRIARAGKWRSDLGKLGWNLAGTVLGSVGCGNIAQELFRLARPLGFARLIACDPYVTPEEVRELGVEIVDMDTVFRESDVVAVNSLLNSQTQGMIGERQFRLMKPTAVFINTARGGIVQHDALVRALREKWIGGAGIDVYPVEPPPKDDPLFELDNVIVAPHALAWTREIMRDNGSEACDNVLAVARGELPSGIVNREVLARPGFRKKLARYRQ